MSTVISIDVIENRLRDYCRLIDQNYDRLVIQREAGHDGTAHLELVGDSYHYVATERGLELERHATDDVEELLYWLVADISFGRAVGYELKHRVRGQSFRRILFAKTIEYLGRVRQDWAERKQAEFAEILREHPIDDVAEG